MALSMQTKGLRAARAQGPAPFARRMCVRASAVETTTVVTNQVLLLNDKSHFQSVLKEAADNNKILVVDYYTTWCGPCKLVAPEVEKMAAEYADKGVQVAKVTCDASNENKKWAMDFKIRSLPTFRVYRDGSEQHVGEVIGTKIAQLRKVVDEQMEVKSG